MNLKKGGILLMVQGTTPTFILTLPNTIDLTAVKNLYFTLEQGNVKLEKNGEDLSVEGQEISVYLSQSETLMFSPGRANLQLNWTYDGGTRACSNIVSVPVGPNLLKEVVS